MEEKGKPLTLLLIAVALVATLSLFAWEDMSGGFFKSFSLISDLTGNTPDRSTQTDYLDPDLEQLAVLDTTRYEYIPEYEPDIEEIAPQPLEEDPDIEHPEPNIAETVVEETVIPTEKNVAEQAVEIAEVTATQKVAAEHARKVAAQPAQKDVEPVIREAQGSSSIVKPNKTTGSAFTDYSGGKNIEAIRKALSATSNRLVRWAVIGDSYIEGDIFTQQIREALQNSYGGKGIGYTPLYSEFPGFRRSILHSCENFEALDFRKKSGNRFSLLPGTAMKAGEGAAATFNGTNKVANADAWDVATVELIAPAGGSVKIRTEKKGTSSTFSFEPSDSLHTLRFPVHSSHLSVSGITPGIIFQGAYFDGDKGIAVDNMSIRGYAGIRHDELYAPLVEQARSNIDYDIIMLEFGINALSAAQKDYTAYSQKMTSVVNKLKKLYPKATFIIMGIGDRGEKRGGEIHSMSTVDAMVAAQREIAKSTGSVFWDTRKAMGGEDAVVQWVKNGEINKDYIHLSFKGGKRLADLFIDDFERFVK